MGQCFKFNWGNTVEYKINIARKYTTNAKVIFNDMHMYLKHKREKTLYLVTGLSIPILRRYDLNWIVYKNKIVT